MPWRQARQDRDQVNRRTPCVGERLEPGLLERAGQPAGAVATRDWRIKRQGRDPCPNRLGRRPVRRQRARCARLQD
ncbi:MAG: hypothetical protein MZV65_22085 [Chromatiales bacterium]|nr:hypothetical protein [Chromatiales bacterium]